MTRMQDGNKFKLGVFAINCSGCLTMTTAPEHWVASWDNNVRVAQLADDAGMEFLLPLGRWLGHFGTTNTQETNFETLTWASGLLAVTKAITVFGTLHMALIHPVFAAKQIVTADHIGKGRFGLNVVAGWNADEFAMFGKDLLEHDERYVFAEEWLAVAKRVWSENAAFDFAGRYFDLRRVLGKPKPYAGGHPLLMSAGSSPAGRAFAARNVDCLFMVIHDVERLAQDIAEVRALAGRPIGVFASSHLIARPTHREAEEYHHYIVYETGDWAGAEYMMSARMSGGSLSTPPEKVRALKERYISGSGTFPVIGSYDEVVATYKRLSNAGLNGLAIAMVNYIDEFHHLRDEVLPRLERLGLRHPAKAAAA